MIIAPAISDEDAKDEVPEGLPDGEELPALHAAAEPLTVGTWRPAGGFGKLSRQR